jgi:outer membrane lipoprotein SlyB
MNLKSIALAATLALGATSASYAPDADAARRYNSCSSCGTVEDVERIWAEDKRLGGGTVLGAVIGAAVGNQVGSGDGRKAATIAGAVAGGAVGHRVEKNRRGDVRGYLVTVRMDRGGYRTIQTRYDYDLDRGDRVRVSGGRVRPLY